MNKKKKIILWTGLVSVLLVAVVVVLLCTGVIGRLVKWIKPPESYTWEEYQAMSNEEKDELFDRFDSLEDFEKWLSSVEPEETLPDFSWNEPGKTPDEYTWEEYMALTAEKKEAFYLWFETEDAFESWKEKAQPNETEPPAIDWDDSEKKPNEYTWEEYQALTPEEQDAFYLWFASKENFETWVNQVKPQEETPTTPTWDLSGKKPDEYTWEEYQALSPEQQDAFYLWFASRESFETWMNQVKPQEETPTTPTWDLPGKKPDEYTWEEYQSLSPVQQDAFYLWFASTEAFEAWMEQANPQESEPETKVWDKPGKLPVEYTWAEYQALSPEEQDLFFQWFESVEAFEAWADRYGQ